jgi:hypothetical protein
MVSVAPRVAFGRRLSPQKLIQALDYILLLLIVFSQTIIITMMDDFFFQI